MLMLMLNSVTDKITCQLLDVQVST